MYIVRITEPSIMFGFGQRLEDPRDGLTLFGPVERKSTYGIRWGLIGTKSSMLRFKRWVKSIQSFVPSGDKGVSRPAFPGFASVFGVPWPVEPLIECEVEPSELERSCYIDDKHQRVYETVNVFSSRIEEALQKSDYSADIWFVVIPEDVYKYCRPTQRVEHERQIKAGYSLTVDQARRRMEDMLLFEEMKEEAEPYRYEVNFHNQLKARLLRKKQLVVTQIVREMKIAHHDFLNALGKPIMKLDGLESAIAWNLCSTTFYKCGAQPWRVGTARDGVCYVGLVFKQNVNEGAKYACCGAQMFLDSGDGVVFKGAEGPFYDTERGTYHLTRKDAKTVIERTVEAYRKAKSGDNPCEIFLHSRIAFDAEEWEGFCEGAGAGIRVVGVRIRESSDLKMFRAGRYAVLRGTACIIGEHKAYLCTRGYVPRLQTCLGLEVPRLLEVIVCRGKADIEVVLSDIMMLTKLNYNACVFGDGKPITIKFSDAVGEILTAGPRTDIDDRPLPFKYYI